MSGKVIEHSSKAVVFCTPGCDVLTCLIFTTNPLEIGIGLMLMTGCLQTLALTDYRIRCANPYNETRITRVCPRNTPPRQTMPALDAVGLDAALLDMLATREGLAVLVVCDG